MSARTRTGWKNAYDAQMGLWRWLRTYDGRRFLAAGYELESRNLETGTREMLAQLYRSEEARLLGADPIYVSEEMCQLVEAAAETFQPEPLYVSDLMTPNGFIYFERPFEVPDRFDEPTTIHAVSWTPMFSSDGEDDRLALAKLLGSRKLDREALEDLLKTEGARLGGITLTIYADSSRIEWPDSVHTVPSIYPMHLTPWWFDMTFEGNELDEHGIPTGAVWWWRIVQSSLRLMQQRIAVKHHERPERHQRREGLRAGFTDREVLVVRLRREQGERHEPSGEPANYSHRFIVSGHWRDQPYPSEGPNVRRQIWISPFIKGSEDLPLVIKPRRAYTLTR